LYFPAPRLIKILPELSKPQNRLGHATQQHVKGDECTGLGVLLVGQNSAMALDISTRAFLMETGTIALSGPSSALADDPRIREAYLGG
jgi:ABC-type branched-subunit amino acid transport system ATPase component